MEKILDLNKSIFELTEEFPELINIMTSLGFTEVSKKAMRHSVGKLVTLPKGAKMKNISLDKLLEALFNNGFTLKGDLPTDQLFPQAEQTAPTAAPDFVPQNRTELLKTYLKRLGSGEDLETVRADFVKNFSEVDASEIMQAEQELIAEGTPLEEVQKLCDIHSALFHGATREEQIANAEKAAMASLQKKQQTQADGQKLHDTKKQRAAELAAIPGHPLYTFTRENEALAPLLQEATDKLTAGEDAADLLTRIRDLSIHYAKKGDLLYPHLKVKYKVSGPSDVMWTHDDEIRDELGKLLKNTDHDAEWTQDILAVLKRADEMIFKEANILFPMCAVHFTEEEWFSIYRDSKDYADSFGVSNETWEAAEKAPIASHMKNANDEIVMPGGHMTLEQLTALLNTVPIEITFIDADNINRFFNEGPKVFKRPGMAIDREVFSCHPPKIEPMVRAIIDDFRNDRRDSVPVWMEKGGRSMLVTYMAVRDKNRKYLGTVEVVQDMEFAKEHFMKQN